MPEPWVLKTKNSPSLLKNPDVWSEWLQFQDIKQKITCTAYNCSVLAFFSMKVGEFYVDLIYL